MFYFFETLHHSIVFYRRFENTAEISHKYVMETGRLCVSLCVFIQDKNGLESLKVLNRVCPMQSDESGVPT